MGVARFISNRPVIVISIWILIALLSFPLFMKLNSVLISQEQGLLPENTESMKASNILENITGSKETSTAILLVDNINISTSDNALKIVNWYMENKDELNRYADEIHGYPSVVYNLYLSLENVSSTSLNQTLSGIDQIVNVTEILNTTYSSSTIMYEQIYNQTVFSKRTLVEIDKNYTSLYDSLQKLRESYILLNQTAYSLSNLWTYMPQLYIHFWFDVSRTHYFLLKNTTVYQTHNLTEADIAKVISLMNISGFPEPEPNTVIYYYSLILNQTNGDPFSTDYKTISNIASNLTMNMLLKEAGKEKELIRGAVITYSTIWNRFLEQNSMTQLPYYYQTKSQLEMYDLLTFIGETVKEASIPIFAQRLAQEFTNKTTFSLGNVNNFFINASKLEFPPQQDTINSMIQKLLITSSQQSPEYQPIMANLYAIISKRDPVPQDALKILLEIMEKQVENPNMLSVIGNILSNYDPGAKGFLVKDNTLLANATFYLMREMISSYNITSTPEVKELMMNLTYQIALHPEEKEKIKNEFLNEIISFTAKKAPEDARQTIQKIGEYVIKNNGINSKELPLIVKKLLVEFNNNTSLQAYKDNGIFGIFVENSINIYFYHNITLEEAIENATLNLFTNIYPQLVDSIKNTLITEDKNAFLIMFKPYSPPSEEDPSYYFEAKNFTNLVQKTLSQYVRGYKLYLTGPGIMNYEVHKLTQQDMKRVDILSNTLVVIFLFLVLESLAAVVIPFIGLFIAITAAGALAYLIVSTGTVDLSSWSRVVMITTSLGLGADYAGFLAYRFREEFKRTGDSRKAAEKALTRTYTAIMTSAATAMIGFGSLALAYDFPFLLSFGVSIPLAILITMLTGLTLVPALLSIFGGYKKFWWPKTPQKIKIRERSWLGEKVIQHKKLILLLWVIISIPSAYAYITFQGSHDMQVFLPENSESVASFNIVSHRFGAGIVYPTYIVIELKEKWNDPKTYELIKNISSEIESQSYVSMVTGPVNNFQNKSLLHTLNTGNPYVDRDGKIVYFMVVLKDNPLSIRGIEEIRMLRDIVHKYDVNENIRGIYVGGMAASMMEMEELLNQRFYHRVLPVAIILMIIVFALAFNSIIASLSAIMVILSAAVMAIGASELVFQDILGKPILWFMPIMVLTAILGVGMDYNSFYLSRAREECEKECSNKAIMLATARVGLLVFGLSMILGSAYLSMLVAQSWGMRELGFTLGIGVLLAGAMASYLVNPSIIAILKDKMWRKIR